MQRIRYVVWGSMVGAVVACSSSGSVNIGDDKTGAATPAWAQGLGGTYSTGPIQPSPVDPSVLLAGAVPPGCEGRQEPFNPTVSYRGYIQNFSQTSYWPSEVVILKLAELTTSAVSGRLLSDQAGPGNYGSPIPGFDCSGEPCVQGAEGFQFTLTDASFDGQRLRFTANRYESMCAWCGQQTPYENSPGSSAYFCVPNGSGHAGPEGCAILPLGTTEWQQWDCAAFTACTISMFASCQCSADGCTARFDPLSFDLTMVGDQLVGSEKFLGNVILTRQAS